MTYVRFALPAALLSLLLQPSGAGPTRVAQIAVAGCAALNRGVCELGAVHELKIWHAGTLRLEAFDTHATTWQRVPGSGVSGGGTLYRLALHADQTSLRLRFDGTQREQQVLQLSAAASWVWQARIEHLDNESARLWLEGELPKVTGAERAHVLHELARREYRVGQSARGAKRLQEAASLAEQLGRLSLARACYCLLAQHAGSAHDFVASHRALARAEQLPDPAEGVTDAYGQALLGNTRGGVAAEMGGLPAAAAAYEHARLWVERGAAELYAHVVNGLAIVSAREGRLLRARSLYLDLLDRDSAQAQSDTCFRAIALGNLGWLELELLRSDAATESMGADATRHLQDSVEHFGRCRATASWRPAHARLSLAYDALRRGDLVQARAGIEQAGTLEDEPRLAPYRPLLSAELALAEGDAAAAAAQFERVYARLQLTAANSTEPSWRALEGWGRALAAQQRWPEAIERFEAAELLLSRAARGVPEPSALTSFFGTHEHSARGLRAAYLASGRSDLAFRALRRAERRYLLALARDQRVWQAAASPAWQRLYSAVLEQQHALSQLVLRASVAPDDERAAAERAVGAKRLQLEAAQEQLLALLGADAALDDERVRAPRAGEVIVAWVRGESGVEAYAAFGGETRHVRYGRAHAPVDTDTWRIVNARQHAHDEPGSTASADVPEAVDDAYLVPFADWLMRARELSVLAFSRPQQLDVHRLLFRGAPLIERVAVAYSLDLPPRAAEEPRAETVREALLASDRRGDLVYAQRELQALREALGARGWRVTELAEASALLQQRERPALFYYAGHGRVDSSGALRSGLVLSDAELTVADILSLPAAPRLAVLSACDAAFAPDLRDGTGVGLAQAFVLAGSDEAIAPVRPVDDRATALFSAFVRDGLAQGEALADVYGRALRASTAPDAYAFRRIVP